MGNEKPVKLVTKFDKNMLDSKDLLENALKEDFDTVLLLGRKDGLMHIRYTGSLDTIAILGMLESIKLKFWEAE